MTFHKYPKILTVGHKENSNIFSNPEDIIYIEEKIDGGNFRFTFIDDKLIFGSRTQQLTSNMGDDSNVPKDFKRVVNYVREQVGNRSFTGLIFYGESCHKHTLDYNWEKIPPFLGFDVLDTKQNKFLNYDDKVQLFDMINLKVVPLIDKKQANEIKEINDNMVPVSEYYSLTNKDTKAEGIVFKNYDKQIFAKYVRDEFKEANAETFGGNPKYNKQADTNDSEFVFKYCTNARIDKIVFKLLDEGHNLELKLMNELPKKVYQDIIEENWYEILNSGWKLDLSNIKRKLISKRCLAVLQQIITNNALK